MKFGKRTRSRLRRNVLMALIAAGQLVTFQFLSMWFYPEPERNVFRWSLSTAYAALIFLSVTLTIGPWNLVRKLPNPASSDLRRDCGIWCAMLSLCHVLLGLNVHMKSWVLYFVNDSGWPRMDLFGAGNYLGGVATILVILLLSTSNDYSIKLLNRTRWKAIQRFNYLLFGLVILHGTLYLAIEKRYIPYAAFMGLISFVVAGAQFIGYRQPRLTAATNSDENRIPLE